METRKFNPSAHFINRLRCAYKLAMNLQGQSESSSVLWDQIIPEKQKSIHCALTSSDEDTRSLLQSMLTHDLYFGVDNLCLSLWGTYSPSHSIDLGQLIKLSEAIGAINFYNPAGGSKYPQKNKPSDVLTVEDFLLRIDKVIGYEPIFPDPFSCEYGLLSSRGAIADRALQAIYQANKIKQLLVLLAGRKVMEIGGGMGRTAYYLYAAGVRDITAIDIPLGMVRQACFLAGSLGEDKVWFFGEPISCVNTEMAPPIKIIPAGSLSFNEASYDIIFNSDSLTEMSKLDASVYVDWAKKNSRCFFSINHEANDFRVADLYSSLIRSTYPLREGYVEEVAFFGHDCTLI
jgi:hypothetical protein